MRCMVKRTNVVLDDEKVKLAKKAYEIETTKQLLDFALDELLKAKGRQEIVTLQGKVKLDLNISKSRLLR